jgi:peptide/nickel transport system permease protein
MAMFGLVMLVLLILYSFGGALFVTESYANFTDTSLRLQPPSAEHPFGTDTIGRDILARTIYGGQISLMIGLTAVIIELMVGIMIGALAGYYGGKLDALLMRFTEALLNIPQIFLLIVMAKYFSGNVPNINLFGRTLSGSVVVIVVIIGLTSWPYLARIVRAEFLSLKEREFVTAARATGTPRFQIIFRHILPNCVAPIVVAATLGVANAISPGGLYQLLGVGSAPAHRYLGQYVGRGLQLYRNRLLDVAFPRPVDRVDRAEHQLPRRRLAGCAGPAQPDKLTGPAGE